MVPGRTRPRSGSSIALTVLGVILSVGLAVILLYYAVLLGSATIHPGEVPLRFRLLLAAMVGSAVLCLVAALALLVALAVGQVRERVPPVVRYAPVVLYGLVALGCLVSGAGSFAAVALVLAGLAYAVQGDKSTDISGPSDPYRGERGGMEPSDATRWDLL